jgi:large subunit ribosomal protein L6
MSGNKKKVKPSRVGKEPIEIPDGISLDIGKHKVVVSGPKGKLEVPIYSEIKVELADSKAKVLALSNSKRLKAFHGLVRALLANAVTGVSQGFEKRLEIRGVGYRADMEGKSIKLSLGFSHTILYDPPEGVEISVESSRSTDIQGIVIVGGIDKQKVGEAAAEIRAFKPPEPYLGKGIRYEGEHVRHKAGKAAVA